MRRLAGAAGGVVKLGSAIGDVCCACARGAELRSIATEIIKISDFVMAKRIQSSLRAERSNPA